MSSLTPSTADAERTSRSNAALPPGLLKSSSTYSLGTISTLVGGLVRAKVAAVVIGTSGVGLVAQLNNLSTVLGAITTMGLSNAGVKLIAEARAHDDETQLNRVITFLFVVPLAFGVIVLVGGLLAAPELSSLTLSTSRKGEYVAVAVVSVPLNLLIASSYVVLQGSRMLTRLAAVTALSAAANTLSVVALVLAFHLGGAVAGVLATSALGLGVVLARERWILSHLSFRTMNPGRRAFRQFLSLGAASVVVGTLSLIVDTVLRSWLVHTHGLSANGDYQPTSMIANQLFLPLVGGIVAYLFPTLTSDLVSRADSVRHSVTQAFRLAILLFVAVAVAILAARHVLLIATFSSQFLGGSSVLALQMPGEVLLAASFVLGTTLLPLERIRAWAFIALFTLGVQTIAGFLLVDAVGTVGLAVAFDLAWLLSTCMTVLVLRRTPLVQPGRQAWLLFGSGLLLVSSAAAATQVVPSPYPEIAASCLCAVWIAVCTKAEERRRLVTAARSVGLRAVAMLRRTRG